MSGRVLRNFERIKRDAPSLAVVCGEEIYKQELEYVSLSPDN